MLHSWPSATEVCWRPLRNSVPGEFKDYFIFTGKLQQIESVISLFDIGVLLSTNGEGLSNVIMEYMALEKAVIATKLDGNTEILADGITGFLIPENNIGPDHGQNEFSLKQPGDPPENGEKRKKPGFVEIQPGQYGGKLCLQLYRNFPVN